MVANVLENHNVTGAFVERYWLYDHENNESLPVTRAQVQALIDEGADPNQLLLMEYAQTTSEWRPAPSFGFSKLAPRIRLRITAGTPERIPRSPADAWASSAVPLAHWAWRRLVNSTARYGQYRPQEEWDKPVRRKDGTSGTLGKTTTRKDELTRSHLYAHFRATRREDLVVLLTTSPDNTSKWGAVDVDCHDPANASDATALAAKSWYQKLRGMGFHPLLLDSNGNGGFHLYVIFDSPVATSRVYALLKWLTDDHAKHGLSKRPELFPKQPMLPEGGCGNWLRVPGRHHTLDHWSRVFDGSTWLDGAAAVAAILALSGDSADLIPPEAEEAAKQTPSSSSSSTVASSPEDWTPVTARRIQGYMDKVPNHRKGEGRNNAAYTAAAWLTRDMALTDAAALSWLTAWDDQNLPPLGEARLREIIGNAKKYGTQQLGSGRVQASPAPGLAGLPSSDTALHLTDLGNARRLVQAHGRDLHYVHPWSKWLHWDGCRWRMDDLGAVTALAKQAVGQMFDEAQRAVASIKEHVGRSGAKPKEQLAEATKLLQHALASESASRLRALLELARSEAGIPILPEQLDRDPWLLNCTNGTLDLKTGTLQEHRRDDYLTKLCPVAFDAAACCPRWLAFLEQIFGGNAELIAYLQRLIGYSLTGSVREQVLPIFYGRGANGKSTLIDTVLALLGADYASKAPPRFLMLKRGDSHPTEIADLCGRRFVAAVESEQNHRLAESLVKDLTGGDRQRARRMREDFWEFAPTHKVILATNHKPSIKGTDHAIWRRIHLIPFEVTIPDRDQDKDLGAKLHAELAGILNWALAGCLAWQREGLGMPQAVRRATAEYRSDEDILGSFIEECCQCESQAKCKAMQLYSAYRAWAQDAGEPALSQKRFGAALTERGFHRGRRSGVTYTGLAPTPEWAQRGQRFKAQAEQEKAT